MCVCMEPITIYLSVKHEVSEISIIDKIGVDGSGLKYLEVNTIHVFDVSELRTMLLNIKTSSHPIASNIIHHLPQLNLKLPNMRHEL